MTADAMRKISAAEKRRGKLAESLCQRKRDEQRRRMDVIAEFEATDAAATLQAMAAEILRYRRTLAQLADAIEWAQAGTPFVTIKGGPYRPTRGDGAPGCLDDSAPSG
jgi:hypothetical protein